MSRRPAAMRDSNPAALRVAQEAGENGEVRRTQRVAGAAVAELAHQHLDKHAQVVGVEKELARRRTRKDVGEELEHRVPARRGHGVLAPVGQQGHLFAQKLARRAFKGS